MTKIRYRVFLGLEEIDVLGNSAKAIGEHFECATFSSRTEALNFITELQENHCACATGESKLMAEMSSPEFFTAGD